MLTPTYRIAILIAKNNFVYRGVGAYAKSIIDWALSENYHIDVISDYDPRDNGLFDQYRGKVQWICPVAPINDPVYKELSSFSKPFDTTLSLNFRNALFKALKHHTYNLIITNVGEALHAVTSLGVHKYCTVLHPTHHESEAGLIVRHDIFSPGVSEQYRALCSLPDVMLACQSEWIQQSCQQKYAAKEHQCLFVPPLLTEPGLLNFDTRPVEQWGVGFIGPWEPRKNPEAYLNLLKQTKLPAVVLVPSESSAKKFKEKLTDAGIEHKIHVGKTGEQKVAIIQSMAAAFHPATSETFGLGALETAHACPTLLLEKNTWSFAHEEYAILTTEQYMAKKLLEVYGTGVSTATKDLLKARDRMSRQILRELVRGGETTHAVPKNNFYTTLADEKLINHFEFVNSRASFCTDEIYKMLRIPTVESVQILHDYNSTYYRERGSNMLPTEETTENLFG